MKIRNCDLNRDRKINAARWALALAGSLVVADAVQGATAGAGSGNANARPIQVDRVVNGAAAFQQRGNNLTIRAADQTIINYQRFSIPTGASVTFVQPSSKASVLNRITGADPTQINGTLRANGSVFFVNPAGIIFGPRSVINVGQLVAAAGSIADQDFLSRNYHFTDVRGNVVNRGSIQAGGIQLIGQQVANFGTLVGTDGAVALVAGNDVLIGQERDGQDTGHMYVKIQTPASASGGAPVSGPGVQNRGNIKAPQVWAGAGDIYAMAVLNSGNVASKDITVQGGKGGTVAVSGRLDASDPTPGAKGGSVTVTGEKIVVAGAKIRAAGDAGGGTVLVGGDLHGQGTTPTASSTLVNASSGINADALSNGDGGKIVVWSDHLTAFYGTISARGGTAGGNGGFVEVSGKDSLIYKGTADLRAPGGQIGTLLLDPAVIFIDTTDVAGDPQHIAAATLVTNLDTADVALSATASITVNNAVNASATTSLTSLTLFAPAINFNAGVSVRGTLQINGPVVLGADVALAGNVVFLAGAVTGAHNLGVTGVTTFGGTVNIAGLTVTGLTFIGGDVTTSGGQTYNGPVTLEVDAVLADTGAGAIQFNGAVDGGHNLTVNTGGATIFGGAVGGTTPLTSVTTDAAGSTQINGGAITTSGGQTFNDPVTLGADAILASTGAGDIHFVNTLDGGHNLTVNTAGASIFDLAVGGTTPLTSVATDAAGTTQINGGAVTTTGGQTFSDAVTLGADTILTSIGAGSIALLGSVDGAHNLTINTAGATVFDGAVGGTTPLTSVTTDAAGSSQINGGAITTTGGQTYNDPVTLGADALLASTGAGTIHFVGAIDGAHNLAINTAGTTIFDGAVGGTTPLTSIATDAPGTTQINGGAVTTTGGQTYNDPVTLGADALLTSTGGGNIDFVATLDGGHNLTVNTAGATIFALAVGGTTPLTSVTTDAPGATQINGGAIATTGAQTFDDALTLGTDTVLTSTGAGTIALIGTVNGAHTLGIDTAGTTTFGGVFGGTTPLTSITTDAPGTAQISSAITTSGGQTYNDPVTLGADAILTSTGSGDIRFLNTLDGGHNLTVNTAGATIFALAVGGTTPLTSITTDAPGTTQINGGAVTTTGGQTFNDAVTLGANTILTSTGAGDVALLGAVDGAHTLGVNTAGATIFGGTVGGTTPLTSVTTDAPGTTQINGGAATTTGGQTYNDPVTLGADAVLASIGGANIDFVATLDGAHNLTVNTGGTTIFGGVAGGTTPLTSVTTDAPGTTQINGGAITTSGGQTYNDPVTLGADAILASTGGGDIHFVNTLDGGHNLTANTAGATIFALAVGGTTPLTSLTTDAPGTTQINGGAVTTTGGQTFNDAVTTGANTILASTGAGDIHLAGTVDGAHTLAINTGGTTIFGGTVGGTTPLTSITTDAPGTTQISAAITTSGGQTYNDPMTLGADAALASTGAGNIDFVLTVNGGHNLTVNTAGLTIFGGAVGGTTPLASVTTDAPGTTQIDGGAITTTGGQTYNDPITLGADAILASTGAGDIHFGSTVNGGHNLTVNTAGTSIFDLAVGGTTPLTSITTDAPGTTQINGGAVTTTGAQTFNDAVTLGANTLLASTGAGNVTLAGTVDGAHTLAVNTGGTTIFGGVVGGTTPLTSITTDVPGTTHINGGAITTTGTQAYNDPVTLGNDATLAGSTITFAAALSGAASGVQALTITGNAVFGSAVGAPHALKSLSVSGTSAINGGVVTTTTFQSYANFVTLGATPTSLIGTLVTFGNGVGDGTKDLVISNNAAFSGDSILHSLTVGGTMALSTGTVTVNTPLSIPSTLTVTGVTSLTAPAITLVAGASGGGSLNLHGSTTVKGDVNIGSLHAFSDLTLNGLNSANPAFISVTTSGIQTYDSTLTLGKQAELTGNAFTFAQAIGGAFALNIHNSGLATIKSDVNVASLHVFGATSLLGTNSGNPAFLAITTTADQSYDGAVTLGKTVDLNGRSVTFGSSISGDQDLNVTNAGTATFKGDVNIAGLHVTGRAVLDGGNSADAGVLAMTTAGGSQTFDSAVTLGKNVDLTANQATFGGAISGEFALNVAASGTFNGDVNIGSLKVTGLASLTGASSGNPAFLSILTSGDQTYLGRVTLGKDTHVEGNGITFSGHAGILGTGTALTVHARGAAEFDGFVGRSGQELASLNVTAGKDLKINSAATTGDISLQAGSSVTEADSFVLPDAILHLGGDLTAGGAINLNAVGRAKVPSVATIVGEPAGATMLLHAGGEFRMGQFEKLVVRTISGQSASGDLTITANHASVGSIVAAGNLTIDVSSLSTTANYPAPAQDLTLEGMPTPDNSVHLVAGKSLVFTKGVSIPGGIGLADIDGNASGVTVPAGSIFKIDAQTFSQTMLKTRNEHGAERVLDYPASGIVNFDVANVIAGAIPREKPKPPEEASITAEMKRQLEQMGLVPRSWAISLLADFMENPPKLIDDMYPDPSDAITTERLFYVRVINLLNAYNAVFWPEAKKGDAGALQRPDPEDPRKTRLRVYNAPAVRDSFARAYAAYGKTPLDPADFRKFIATSPQAADARKQLELLSRLFTALDALGLTPVEAHRVHMKWLGFAPEGITPEQMERVIVDTGSGGGK